MSDKLDATDRAHIGEHPWPTGEQIAQVHEKSMRGQRWSRDWAFHAPTVSCPHTRCSVFTTSTGWEVEVCDKCGQTARSTCTHIEMEWNEEGTMLRCVVCGHDGT